MFILDKQSQESSELQWRKHLQQAAYVRDIEGAIERSSGEVRSTIRRATAAHIISDWLIAGQQIHGRRQAEWRDSAIAGALLALVCSCGDGISQRSTCPAFVFVRRA